MYSVEEFFMSRELAMVVEKVAHYNMWSGGGGYTVYIIHSLLHFILGVCTNCEAEIYGSVGEQVMHFIGRLIQSLEWRRLYTLCRRLLHSCDFSPNFGLDSELGQGLTIL